MAVPVIDIAPFAQSESAGRDVARAIGRACETIGFFAIVGHGVPASLDRACWDAARAFFDLPLEERERVAFPHVGYPYGYARFAGETLAVSRGEATPPDLKESYASGPLIHPARGPRDQNEAFVYSPNLWPGRPEGFRAAWQDYYRAMEALAARLMTMFAIALDLPRHFFDDKIDYHVSALRALNYPDHHTEPLPGQLRAGAHSDYGSLTILRQENAPGGLEVLTRDNAWTPVPAIDGAYVVNIGDLMARWTNDLWVSTMHRVVNPPPDATGSTRRQSIAFFHQPNWDATIECLPSCAKDGAGPKYPPVESGAYLMSKFTRTVDPEADMAI